MYELSDNALLAIAVFVPALLLGSFFNVVAYRLPRGQLPWKPARSHCPECDAEILKRDNMPVIGWLLLRGRCRNCGSSISWRYPIFELLTGILFSAAAWHFGLTPELLPALLLISTLIIVSNSDLELQLIPNKVIVPALVLGVAAQLYAVPSEWLEWTLSALIAFAVMFAVALIYPRGMGMGDVKLAAVLGLYLGRAVAPAMMMAFLLGTIFGLAIMARQGVAAGRKAKVPFGPFMAAGGVFGLFWGDQVVEWYLDSFTQG